jgi:selenide,water dikinase
VADETIDSDALWRQAKAGGCARKLPPSLLEGLLPRLNEDGDSTFMEDAVEIVIGTQTLVQSVDFITALVPNPEDFGRIAAANALSDVYVAGAWPRCALAIACSPVGESFPLFQRALLAAREYLDSYGCVLVGGHSIVDEEAKLGFAVTGTLSEAQRLLTRGAVPGDVLILTKPLGVGIATSGFRKGAASQGLLDSAIELMREPNDWVPRLLESPAGNFVHAATDVSGFGLLGHAMELCKRSGVAVTLQTREIPVLEGVRELANAGICTTAAPTNEEYVERHCVIVGFDALSRGDQLILTDPQTSGGVLLAVDPNKIEPVRSFLHRQSVLVAQIGEITPIACQIQLV